MGIMFLLILTYYADTQKLLCSHFTVGCSVNSPSRQSTLSLKKRWPILLFCHCVTEAIKLVQWNSELLFCAAAMKIIEYYIIIWVKLFYHLERTVWSWKHLKDNGPKPICLMGLKAFLVNKMSEFSPFFLWLVAVFDFFMTINTQLALWDCHHVT